MHSLLPSGSFFGQTLRTQDSMGFHFVEADFASSTHIPSHAHESAFFYLVLDGSCEEEYGRRSRYCQTNALIFHPATHSHANIWPHRGRTFNIEIVPRYLAEIQRYASVPQDSIELVAGKTHQIVRRLYREFQQSDFASSLILESLALELIAEVSRSAQLTQEPNPPHWLRTVIALLEARYQENLSLTEIAATVDMHPSHLARVFRQHYRTSIGDYIRRLRLEYSCRQLAAAELTLGQIAFTAGFADQSHFTKTFKRFYGVTPAQYQRTILRCK